MYFTSTSLTVSTENGVKTYPLEIKNHEDKKTELLQKMDASRRATNPDNYNEDGTKERKKVKSKDGIFQKLIKNIVLNFTKFTARNARKKKLLQEILANEVIASGDVFNCNKMDFKFLQRNLGKKIQSASPLC